MVTVMGRMVVVWIVTTPFDRRKLLADFDKLRFFREHAPQGAEVSLQAKSAGEDHGKVSRALELRGCGLKVVRVAVRSHQIANFHVFSADLYDQILQERMKHRDLDLGGGDQGSERDEKDGKTGHGELRSSGSCKCKRIAVVGKLGRSHGGVWDHPVTLILASGSPRRKELLEREGIPFVVRSSSAEELPPGARPWSELCQANAELKAMAVDPGEGWLIAADTLVQIDGEVLGKPRDMDEAREMLRKLSGRSHEVRTGVCLRSGDGRRETFVVSTLVQFRRLDEETIHAYFEKVDPLDKAGAYGIQEHGEMIVEGIEGDFDNVMGLPVTELVARLKACGALP